MQQGRLGRRQARKFGLGLVIMDGNAALCEWLAVDVMQIPEDALTRPGVLELTDCI